VTPHGQDSASAIDHAVDPEHPGGFAGHELVLQLARATVATAFVSPAL